MTLDEAIKHCEEKASGCGDCSNEHRQLAEWLVELKSRRERGAEMICDCRCCFCSKYVRMNLGGRHNNGLHGFSGRNQADEINEHV